jgi:magnesium chelatase family protein
MVTRYQKRIVGPLLDRIDIHIEVPRVVDTRSCPTTGWVSHRPSSARGQRRHARRFAWTNLLTNADMGAAEVREYCAVDEAGPGAPWALLRAATLVSSCP